MLDWVGNDKPERVQPSHVRNPEEGKTLMFGTLQMTIKATGAETGGRFALAEVTIPPYYAEIWPHLHQETTKALYLTKGLLAVTLGEETMVVRQGSFILVQPNQAHRFWNPTATPTTFLAFFAPAGAEEFFEAVAAAGLAEHKQLPGELAKLWALGMRFDHFPATADEGVPSVPE